MYREMARMGMVLVTIGELKASLHVCCLTANRVLGFLDNRSLSTLQGSPFTLTMHHFQTSGNIVSSVHNTEKGERSRWSRSIRTWRVAHMSRPTNRRATSRLSPAPPDQHTTGLKRQSFTRTIKVM
jgi:hypothetical protein